MRLSQPAKIAVGCGVGGVVLAGAAVFVIYWFNRRAQVAARRDEGSTWGDGKEAPLGGGPPRTVDSLQAVEQSERLAQAKAQQPLGHSSSAAEAPLRDPFGNGYSTSGPLEWPREAYAALAALSKDAGAYKRLLTDLLVQVSAAEGLGWRRGAGSVCWLQTFLVACVEQHNAAPLPRCWSRRCTS